MHILDIPPALAEIRELYRQWKHGALTNEEYTAAFRMVDAAHSHDTLCANGDHRPAVVIDRGRPLCGICGNRARQARA